MIKTPQEMSNRRSIPQHKRIYRMWGKMAPSYTVGGNVN
jgi:hypothetical protein